MRAPRSLETAYLLRSLRCSFTCAARSATRTNFDRRLGSRDKVRRRGTPGRCGVSSRAPTHVLPRSNLQSSPSLVLLARARCGYIKCLGRGKSKLRRRVAGEYGLASAEEVAPCRLLRSAVGPRQSRRTTPAIPPAFPGSRRIAASQSLPRWPCSAACIAEISSHACHACHACQTPFHHTSSSHASLSRPRPTFS